MTLLDTFLLLLIAALVVFAVRTIRRAHRRGGCVGRSACSKACEHCGHRTEKRT